jgi:hypothetical protein
MTESEQAQLETAIGQYVRDAISGLCSGKSQDELEVSFVEQGFPEAENVVDFALLIAQHALDINEETDSTETATNLRKFAEPTGFSKEFCDSMIEFASSQLAAIPEEEPDPEMNAFLKEAGIDPQTAAQMVELARIIINEDASRESLITGLVEADVMPEDESTEFVDGALLAESFAEKLRQNVPFETLAPEMMTHAPWITYAACELAR